MPSKNPLEFVVAIQVPHDRRPWYYRSRPYVARHPRDAAHLSEPAAKRAVRNIENRQRKGKTPTCLSVAMVKLGEALRLYQLQNGNSGDAEIHGASKAHLTGVRTLAALSDLVETRSDVNRPKSKIG